MGFDHIFLQNFNFYPKISTEFRNSNILVLFLSKDFYRIPKFLVFSMMVKLIQLPSFSSILEKVSLR